MNLDEITSHLSQMPTVRFQSHDLTGLLKVENDLAGFSLNLNIEKVKDLLWVVSPFGEDCIQLFNEDGSMLIISPNDFVFDVRQEGMIHVQNLPPIVSVTELLMGFKDYRVNPLPSLNYDENLGLFYLHLYIFKSAEQHGISIHMLPELIQIGKDNGMWMQA
jgi:hypothetical protein